jgi:hypothetical protein
MSVSIKAVYFFAKATKSLEQSIHVYSKSHIFLFRSVPSFRIGSSAKLGMPRNEHFLSRNNGNCSESIPRNFFGMKFRSQP